MSKPPLRPPTAKERLAANEYAASQRHRHVKPIGGRVAALANLKASLIASADYYRVSDLQGQRDAVHSTLVAVREFLEAQGFAPATLEPLMRPSIALLEREQNTLDPMFAERARGGRPARTMDEDEKLGLIAAMAEYWLPLHKHEYQHQTDRLSAIARAISGKYLGEVDGARIKFAREIANQESNDHAVVRWSKFHTEALTEMAELFGREYALTGYIDFLNR